jgi:hypothetical protein
MNVVLFITIFSFGEVYRETVIIFAGYEARTPMKLLRTAMDSTLGSR